MEQDILIQRLSVVKVLFDEAKSQALRNDTSSIISILTMHDAIENFLVLIIESQIPSFNENRMNFLKNFEIISKHIKNFYYNYKTMDRFNAVRVGLKHRGNIPNKFNIKEFMNEIEKTITFNCNLIFDIDFLTIETKSLDSNAPEKDYVIENPEKPKLYSNNRIHNLVFKRISLEAIYPVKYQIYFYSWLLCSLLTFFLLLIISGFVDNLSFSQIIVLSLLSPLLIPLMIFSNTNPDYFQDTKDLIMNSRNFSSVELEIFFVIGLLSAFMIFYFRFSIKEAENQQKNFYSAYLQDLFLSNSTIPFKFLMKKFKINDIQIYRWIGDLNPEYCITIEQKSVKTKKIPLTAEECLDIYKKLQLTDPVNKKKK